MLTILLKQTFIELLPFWFYLAGSVCFALGTIIVIVRRMTGELG